MDRRKMGTGTNGGGSSNQTKKLGVEGVANLFKFGYERRHVLGFGRSVRQPPSLERGAQNRAARKSRDPEQDARLEGEGNARRSRPLPPRNRDRLPRYPAAPQHAGCRLARPQERRDGGFERGARKGVVRTHGTSCHTLEAIRTASRTPWVQVDLARINPAQAAGPGCGPGCHGCRTGNRARRVERDEGGGKRRYRDEDFGRGQVARQGR